MEPEISITNRALAEVIKAALVQRRTTLNDEAEDAYAKWYMSRPNLSLIDDLYLAFKSLDAQVWEVDRAIIAVDCELATLSVL